MQSQKIISFTMKSLKIFKDYINNKIFKNKADKPWSSFEYFDPKWKGRIRAMSQYIDESDKSILDLGCGKMWLKAFLKENIIYYGCDYIQRNENTIVCDFNKYEFPKINVDVCFVSGLAEYINDLDWFFEKISQTSKAIIISYCTTDNISDVELRKRQGWKNNLSHCELIELITSKGFTLLSTNNKIKGNEIFKFERG